MSGERSRLPADKLTQLDNRIDNLFELRRWDEYAAAAIEQQGFDNPPAPDLLIARARRHLLNGAHSGPGPGEVITAIRTHAAQMRSEELALQDGMSRMCERWGIRSTSIFGRRGTSSLDERRAAARKCADDDVAHPPGAPRTEPVLLRHVLVLSTTKVRACTPSVLLDQEVAKDILNSDTSVSYPRIGTPIGGDGVFERINRVVAEYYNVIDDDDTTVDNAWALVNGSTGANWSVARLLRLRLDNDQTVLVARGSHVSVPQSLTDFGVRWSYIECDYVDTYEAVLPPSADRLEATLDAEENVGAVWVNGPSYEGAVVNARELKATLIDRGLDWVPLIVDEAWGSHFPGSPRFEEHGSVGNGADLVNASTHKAAGGLQGTAVLVRSRDSCLSPTEIDAAVKALYSTSPSFHLLASIEATYGLLNADRSLVLGREQLAAELRTQLERHCGAYGITFFGEVDAGGPIDPLKVTVGVHMSELTGYKLATALADAGVIAEKDGYNTLTFLVTHQLDLWDVCTLAARFAEVLDAAGTRTTPRPPLKNAFKIVAGGNASPSAVARQVAKQYVTGAPAEVPLAEALNHRAGERIAVYPPGVPLFVEGQLITQDHIDFITAGLDEGAHLHRSSGSRGRSGDPDRSVLVVP